jgi:DNA-binding transcriptional LysR family regulator
MPRPSQLSFDLLETFLRVVEADGDAAAAARLLDINQPSMSKRLAVLQRPGPLLPRPWLVRRGKTWRLTAEGERVLEAVREMVRRREQLHDFLHARADDLPDVSVACGQEAVTDLVLPAVKRFRRRRPHGRVRIATPSGRDRVTGVATGVYDLALITHEPDRRPSDKIEQMARRPLYVESLLEDRPVLAAARSGGDEGKAAWRRRFVQLPADEPAPATVLVGLPLILPERGRGRREQFDLWAKVADVGPLDVVVEVGGWAAILAYAAAGLGVGLATERSAARFLRGGGRLEVRRLDATAFPADTVRLLAPKAHRDDRPQLSPAAEEFLQALRDTIADEAAGKT